MYNICLPLLYLNYQSERKVTDQTNSAFTLTYGSTESWVELIVTESMYEAALANPRVSHKHDLKQPLSGGWSHFLISLLM